MASTPESSEHTSIKTRIQADKNPNQTITTSTDSDELKTLCVPIKPLLHFDESVCEELQIGIPFSYKEYLTLVDWTGRVIRTDKKGFISGQLSPILERLRVNRDEWLSNATQFEANYRRCFQVQIKTTLDDTG